MIFWGEIRHRTNYVDESDEIDHEGKARNTSGRPKYNQRPGKNMDKLYHEGKF